MIIRIKVKKNIFNLTIISQFRSFHTLMSLFTTLQQCMLKASLTMALDISSQWHIFLQFYLMGSSTQFHKKRKCIRLIKEIASNIVKTNYLSPFATRPFIDDTNSLNAYFIETGCFCIDIEYTMRYVGFFQIQMDCQST